MRITVYLVRHAESRSNVDPLFEGSRDDLTDAGSAQAKALAARFKNADIHAVYTSCILRAQLTASEIGQVVGVTPTELDFIRERKGSFSSDKEYSHGEAFDELKVRLNVTRLFLENLEHRHVVVVSHAIFLKSLAAHLMLGDALTEDALNRIEGTLVAENTGVSKFVFNKEKGKWRIMSWNGQTHLMS